MQLLAAQSPTYVARILTFLAHIKSGAEAEQRTFHTSPYVVVRNTIQFKLFPPQGDRKYLINTLNAVHMSSKFLITPTLLRKPVLLVVFSQKDTIQEYSLSHCVDLRQPFFFIAADDPECI